MGRLVRGVFGLQGGILGQAPWAAYSALEQQLLTTPLSEILYLIQGAYPTSTLSDYSTPSGVPFSLTINTPARALTRTAT